MTEQVSLLALIHQREYAILMLPLHLMLGSWGQMKTAEGQLKYLWHCWCLTYAHHLLEAPANGLHVDLGSAERGTGCLEHWICAISGDSAYSLKLKKPIREKGE
jgi:hypothetical protein